MPKLTVKQHQFCDEYLVDLNATRAYMAVYHNIKNEETAASAASRLLRNVNVSEYINIQLEKLHDERTADAKEVMEYLTSVLRGDSKSEIVVVEGMGEGCSSARKMDKTPDEKERLKAAELLGRRYGIFTDKIKTDVDTQLNISIDYGGGKDELKDSS